MEKEQTGIEYAYGDDPLEERVGAIEGELQAQAQERQRDEEVAALLERHPALSDEATQDRVYEEAKVVAEEAERERGEPGLAARWLDDPRFIEDVWTERLDSGAALKTDGGDEPAGELNESDRMFIDMAAEATAKRLDWD